MTIVASDAGPITTNGGSPGPQSAEGSLRGSTVALLTPFLALAASWLAGVVARGVPGVTLDPSQITAVMVAVVGAVLTVAWKWLQVWQRHEQNVCDHKATPIKRPKPAK
jgi:hypothetical protein